MSRYHEIARELGLDESMPKTAAAVTTAVAYTDTVACEIRDFLDKEAHADRTYPLTSMMDYAEKQGGIEITPELYEFVKSAEVAGWTKTEITDFLLEKSAAGGIVDRLKSIFGLGALGATSRAIKGTMLNTSALNQANNVIGDVSSNLKRLNDPYANPTWGERIGSLLTGTNVKQYGIAQQEQKIQELMPILAGQTSTPRREMAKGLFAVHSKPMWQNKKLQEQMSDWAKNPVDDYPETAAGRVAEWWDKLPAAKKKLVAASLGGAGLVSVYNM